MGFFGDLFKGSQTEIDAAPFTTTPIDTKRESQIGLTDSLSNLLRGITDQGGRVDPYSGDLTAQTSGLEQKSFDSIMDLFQSGGQPQNFIQNALGQFNPQQTIDRFNEYQRPFAERNQEESRRRLLERFAGVGGFDSGASRRAFARGETDFNLGLQSQLGNQLNIDQKRQDARNLTGLNALLNIQDQGVQGGGVERGIEQGGLDRILNEFVRGQGADPLLNLTQTALGSDTFSPFINQGSTEVGPSAASQIGQLMAGAGKLATGLAASDERYKKNIKPLKNVLETVDEIQGVSYKWKADEFPDKEFNDESQIGVIAQDVEKVYPELVHTDAEGFKSVRYDLMAAVLIEAVKELKDRVVVLEEETQDSLISVNS